MNYDEYRTLLNSFTGFLKSKIVKNSSLISLHNKKNCVQRNRRQFRSGEIRRSINITPTWNCTEFLKICLFSPGAWFISVVHTYKYIIFNNRRN